MQSRAIRAGPHRCRRNRTHGHHPRRRQNSRSTITRTGIRSIVAPEIEFDNVDAGRTSRTRARNIGERGAWTCRPSRRIPAAIGGRAQASTASSRAHKTARPAVTIGHSRGARITRITCTERAAVGSGKPALHGSAPDARARDTRDRPTSPQGEGQSPAVPQASERAVVVARLHVPASLGIRQRLATAPTGTSDTATIAAVCASSGSFLASATSGDTLCGRPSADLARCAKSRGATSAVGTARARKIEETGATAERRSRELPAQHRPASGDF